MLEPRVGRCLGVGVFAGCLSVAGSVPRLGAAAKHSGKMELVSWNLRSEGCAGGVQTLVTGDSVVQKETCNLSHRAGGLPSERRRQLGEKMPCFSLGLFSL